MNQDYEMQEAIRHHNYILSLDRAPLAERKEAQANFLNLIADPSHTATLTEYLLNGDYGKGPYDICKRIAPNKRMNRAAAIAQLLAAYECRCSARNTIAAWKQLTPAEQKTVNAAILAVIESKLAED